jgi:sulfur carrier protein ThiS
LTEEGRAGVADLHHEEHLNSPHSVAVDVDGNLYVSEWLLGGRYTKFALRD